MGESKRVIEIKKEELAEEISEPQVNKFKIERLKESIKRHKKWERERRLRKLKKEKKRQGILLPRNSYTHL